MSRTEPRDFLRGYHRRRRDAWERTRLLGDIFARVNTGKPLDLPLPWDTEMPEADTPTADDFQRLEALARAWEDELNSTNPK